MDDIVVVLDKICGEINSGVDIVTVRQKFLEMVNDEMNQAHWNHVKFVVSVLNGKNAPAKCIKYITEVKDKIVAKREARGKPQIADFPNEAFRNLLMRIRESGLFAKFSEEEDSIIGALLVHVNDEGYENAVIKILGYEGGGDCRKQFARILTIAMSEAKNLYHNLMWVKSVCSDEMLKQCGGIFASIEKINPDNTLVVYNTLWGIVRMFDFSIDQSYYTFFNRLFRCKNANQVIQELEKPVPIELNNYSNALKLFVHMHADWKKYFALFIYSSLKWVADGKITDQIMTSLIVEMMNGEKFPLPYFIPREKIELVKRERADDDGCVVQTADSEILEILRSVTNVMELAEILPAFVLPGSFEREILDKHGYVEIEKLCSLKNFDSLSDAKYVLIEAFNGEVPDIFTSAEVWADKKLLYSLIEKTIAEKKFDIQKVIADLSGVA